MRYTIAALALCLFAPVTFAQDADKQAMLTEIQELKRRLASLEARLSAPATAPVATAPVATAPVATAPAAAPTPFTIAPPPSTPAAPPAPDATAAAPEAHPAPFAFGDFTWMNGQSRQKSQPLTNQFGTLSLYLDTYYNSSFNHPKDDTIVGSNTTGRNGEVQVNLMSVSFDTLYKNIIGKVSFQAGDSLSIVQDQDASVNRGRFLTTSNLKYIGEAVAGYHFDKGSGINAEAGIFYSYIGLESYLLAENWNYNRSLASDFTPFYFEGARLQIFPNNKIKIEPWVMNGFQSFGKWNKNSAIGLSLFYRPTEKLATAASFYYGTDTRDDPQRKRFHHDHSILERYYNHPDSKGLSKMAISLNNHYGYETGGVNPAPGRKAYFAASTLANRFWFDHDRFAFTVRAEALTNPTRYLAPAPTINGFLSGPDNYSLKIWGATATADYMPTDFMTFRAEFISRHSNVPFFAGAGGTTGANPDVNKHENRLTFAVNWRM